MIRVHVSISRPVARAGVEAVLRAQSDLELTDEARSADVIIAETVPDARDDAAALVLLADSASAAWTPDLLRHGIRALLRAEATPAQIIAAVYAAAAGLTVVPFEDAAAFIPDVRDRSAVEPLTPRETQVLEMLAEGVSNKEIAARLGISEHTAKFHVNSILAKLQASTRTEAVIRGIRAGLIMV